MIFKGNLKHLAHVCDEVVSNSNVVNFAFLSPINFMMPLVRVRRLSLNSLL